MERTLILLKPDCVRRRLMGRAIARFEDHGGGVMGRKSSPPSGSLRRRIHVIKPDQAAAGVRGRIAKVVQAPGRSTTRARSTGPSAAGLALPPQASPSFPAPWGSRSEPSRAARADQQFDTLIQAVD